MKKIKMIAVLFSLTFVLCSCSAKPAENGQNTENTPEATEPAKDPKEVITEVLTQYSKWEINDSQGIMVFKADGTGSFKSQLGDLDMKWEILEDEVIKTSFDYNGKGYGASYKLEEVGDSYQLSNVSHAGKIFKPVK